MSNDERTDLCLHFCQNLSIDEMRDRQLMPSMPFPFDSERQVRACLSVADYQAGEFLEKSAEATSRYVEWGQDLLSGKGR